MIDPIGWLRQDRGLPAGSSPLRTCEDADVMATADLDLVEARVAELVDRVLDRLLGGLAASIGRILF